MGGAQSVRATQFSRPEEEVAVSADDCDVPNISISNKMVERLVEDASLTKSAAAAAAAASVTRAKPSKQEEKELKFIDRLKAVDNIHTERAGLTVEELRSLYKRLELRAANLPELQDVCHSFRDNVIQCYNAGDPPSGVPDCWRTVFDFTKCVNEATVDRLHSRAVREAREQARLTQCVAQARREHTLKDIAPRLGPKLKQANST